MNPIIQNNKNLTKLDKALIDIADTTVGRYDWQNIDLFKKHAETTEAVAILSSIQWELKEQLELTYD